MSPHSKIELRGMKIPAQPPQIFQPNRTNRINMFERESCRLIAACHVLIIFFEGEPQGCFMPAPKNLGCHGFDSCQDCDRPHCCDRRFVINPNPGASFDARRTTPQLNPFSPLQHAINKPALNGD